MEALNNLQLNFFTQLKQKIEPQKLMANEVATVLGISKSEAYSKINGNSSLTLIQLEILCNKFCLNFEVKPTSITNSCIAKFTPFNTGKITIKQYIERLNMQMQFLAGNGLKNLICSTDDIPFFHLFKYKELTAFKLHFWNGRIFTQRNNLPEQVFNGKEIDKKTIANANELYKVYQQIACTEIWTKAELLIIIDQIKYSIESKLLIDKKLITIICEQLLLVLDDIECYAINGFKNKNYSSSFDWFFCDVVGNVSYLANLNKGQACFLRFNTFNNFESTDDSICTEVSMWLQSLLTDAIGFSGHGSKHRNIYLQNVRKAIQSLYL